MQLGNPTAAKVDANNFTNYLIERAQYAMDYNDTFRQPNWVSWSYTTGDSGGTNIYKN
jgi:DNA/RNA endonuclease G (NUC1)